MMRSSLCDYSYKYIHVKRTITIPNSAVAGAAANNTNKKVILKNCATFTKCISEINNAQIDDAFTLPIILSVCSSLMDCTNLIEYSDIYSKPSGSL